MSTALECATDILSKPYPKEKTFACSACCKGLFAVFNGRYLPDTCWDGHGLEYFFKGTFGIIFTAMAVLMISSVNLQP